MCAFPGSGPFRVDYLICWQPWSPAPSYSPSHFQELSGHAWLWPPASSPSVSPSVWLKARIAPLLKGPVSVSLAALWFLWSVSFISGSVISFLLQVSPALPVLVPSGVTSGRGSGTFPNAPSAAVTPCPQHPHPETAGFSRSRSQTRRFPPSPQPHCSSERVWFNCHGFRDRSGKERASGRLSRWKDVVESMAEMGFSWDPLWGSLRTWREGWFEAGGHFALDSRLHCFVSEPL